MRRVRLQQLIRYAVMTLAILCVFYLLNPSKEKAPVQPVPVKELPIVVVPKETERLVCFFKFFFF